MPKRSPSIREVEVTLTRKVRQVENTCPVCQKRFWGSPFRTYCSTACKSKANYGRHAEAYRGARMEKYRSQKKQAAKKRGK